MERSEFVVCRRYNILDYDFLYVREAFSRCAMTLHPKTDRAVSDQDTFE